MTIKVPSRRSKRWKGYRAMRDGRNVATKATIYRTTQVGASSNFMACVRVGKGATSTRSGVSRVRDVAWAVCASGRNPRRALGRAFAKLGRGVSKRSGAFAGYSKSHRKARRVRRGSKRRS